MSLVKATDENFQQETESGIVLVDFWAEWCGPCKMLNPIMEKVSKEFKVVKAKVEECQRAATFFHVKSLPMLLFIKDGNIQQQIQGVRDYESIIKILKSL